MVCPSGRRTGVGSVIPIGISRQAGDRRGARGAIGCGSGSSQGDEPDKLTRLRRILVDAAHGRFPPVDFGVEVLAAPPGRADAVVAFSGHNLIAAAIEPAEVLAQLPDDDPGAPMGAPFLTWLGARLDSRPGMLDAVLVADADPAPQDAPPLLRRDDADAHARVTRALRYRSAVTVYADEERGGLVILGRGLAGRLEVSIEVDPERRGRGIGTSLARRARSLAPADEPLFAQISPGNVASLRAFLRAGYRPICAEVLFLRSGPPPGHR